MLQHNLLVVVPENSMIFEASGLVEIFSQANDALPVTSGLRRYACVTATPNRDRIIHGRSGLTLLADVSLTELDPRKKFDTIVVAGGGSTTDFPDPDIVDWLRLAVPGTARVVSICTGAFYLAEAGLLKGKRATTHWKRVEEMAQRYPEVHVERNPIFVQDGKVSTSAGVSAGFDLALALVEADLGSQVAREVARHMILFLRRPGGQSQFSRFLERQIDEPGPISTVQTWILEHLEETLSVERLADVAAMSPRNFARVFSEKVGVTPARYVEELRVEAAKQRLEQGNETLEAIAAGCGLGSSVSLRRSFDRQLGIGPVEYRERFGRN